MLNMLCDMISGKATQYSIGVHLNTRLPIEARDHIETAIAEIFDISVHGTRGTNGYVMTLISVHKGRLERAEFYARGFARGWLTCMGQ